MDILIIAILFVVSFLLALRSTADLGFGHVVEGLIERKKVTGSILFLKDKIIHYSASSSSPSL